MIAPPCVMVSVAEVTVKLSSESTDVRRGGRRGTVESDSRASMERNGGKNSGRHQRERGDNRRGCNW
jgi:hypothetical protein